MLTKNETQVINLSFQIPGEKMTILSPIGIGTFGKCLLMIVPDGKHKQYQMIGLNLSPEEEKKLFDLFDGSLHVKTYADMEEHIISLKDRIDWLEEMLEEQEEESEEDNEGLEDLEFDDRS